MNKTVAGGVVAWLVTDTETGMTRVNEHKTIEGAEWMKQEALVRQSELDELIADVAEYQANLTNESNARIAAEDALTAAQAEADRLRVDAERYRWLCDNLATVPALMDRDQYATPQRCVEALMPLDDTTIHAAKTEQAEG